jgi:Ni,Fe-hydrogenase III large subunit/Ni,Fe-hydrogenase III component G
MKPAGFPVDPQPVPGAVPAAIARVTPAQWNEAARRVHEEGSRLVALWGVDNRDRDATFAVLAAYATHHGLVVVELPIPAPRPRYPDLSQVFPVAARMQRAIFDLLGIEAEGAPDPRPWLDHGAWTGHRFPLRRGDEAPASRTTDGAEEAGYPFVHVEGDGVHEIPVGPIHAGIIEPGHFRFSIVGEKVLRLEERLGYTHKGIDKRFEAFDIAEGYRLAGRISGDSTVAYAWAYAQAAESLLAVVPPPRARWLRALMLERERVANHLGDLGALGNDAAFGFSLAQFMRIKEDWLRLNDRVFGHRFMMDRIVPGGVDATVSAAAAEAMVAQAHEVEAELALLKAIFDDHAGLQDRFLTTWRVIPKLAAQLGLTGLAGRASGRPFDLRSDHPCEPYDQLEPRKVVHASGDVAARVRVRFDELRESLRLVRAILLKAPDGEARIELPQARPGAFGVGWVEGWRGEVFIALEAGSDGGIRRAHAHDPSWQNWPLVEHAVIGNIVPDFPLINKSFNLSYSGHDS